MKSLLFTSLYFILLISSCGIAIKESSVAEKLYIKTTTYTGIGPTQIKTETISEITSDYFEVGLRFLYGLESISEGQYIATKDIIRPSSDENFKNVFLNIVHKDGSLIIFSLTTDLLNFMSAHGYEMVDQLKNDEGVDYTFKKKK
jgi:hypothetical protein